MGIKRFASVIVAILLVVSTVGGCGSKNNNPGASPTGSAGTGGAGGAKQEIVMNYRAEPPALDVSIAESAASFTILGAISEGLYRLDNDLKPVPGLAQELPEISSDGLTYTIKLREGLKWADGSPLTAEDFVYSYTRTLNPATKASYAFMVAWIKGGNAMLTARTKEEYEQAKQAFGAKAIDPTTLQITLEQPLAYFTSQLAFLNFFPQKKEFVEQHGAQSGADADKVLGAGPFKLTKWAHDQQLVMEKNPNYWDAANVQLTKVTLNIVKDTATGLNLYESNATDYTDIKGDQMKAYEGKVDLVRKNELVTGYLNLQSKTVPAFANIKVREALSAAIDREGLVNTVLMNGSVASSGFVPNGNSDGNGQEFREVAGNTQTDFNPDHAKQQLSAGLTELGIKELPTLSVIGDDTETGKKLLEFLVSQWKTNLGINVQAEPLPHATRLERELSHNYNIVSTLWGADYNDPMTWLDMFVTDGPFNTQDWSNKQYDELIAGAQHDLSNDSRAQKLYEAEKILLSEAAVIPLYFRSSPFLIKEKVQGIVLPPYGPDFELKWASIR